MPTVKAVAVQLATLAPAVPRGDAWLHEIKLDGYRIVARIEAGKAQLITRNHHDWTDRAPQLALALSRLTVSNAMLDGEMVCLLPDGRSSFQALQNAISEGRSATLVYYAFDLLFLNGHDLRSTALVDRKEKLAALLQDVPEEAHLRLSDHIVGEGERLLAQARKLGLEGIVSKRKDAPYQPGRSKDWLKIKCVARQEFVIGGYTLPAGSRTHLGALLVGVREGAQLRYAGKVGTGFTQASLKELHRQLVPLKRSTSPFSNPPRGALARHACWVQPTLVAEVSFTEFTQDGHLRHPSFQGLREDKAARLVVQEYPRE